MQALKEVSFTMRKGEVFCLLGHNGAGKRKCMTSYLCVQHSVDAYTCSVYGPYIRSYGCFSGKSTLINLITGLMTPSHGKIFLAGMDVESDSSQIQQSLGVCAQDGKCHCTLEALLSTSFVHLDLLWDELTAKEHMFLFAAFKGLTWGEQLNTAVDNMLHRVELFDRRNSYSKNFSGGMKRRLRSVVFVLST